MAGEVKIDTLNGLWGVLGLGLSRSLGVNVFTYPLEVIKTNQQVGAQALRSYQVVAQLYRSMGMGAFFRGIGPHMAKGVVKQTVWWPAIAYVPPFLTKYKVSRVGKYAITGFSVAFLDALFNSPLEKWRVVASTRRDAPIKASVILANGWKGFLPYFRRQGVTWSLFLYGQEYFKKPYKRGEGQKKLLTVPQLLVTSCKLSLVANLIIAPFDTMNSIKQSQIDERSVMGKQRSLFQRVRLSYRGLPLNFLIMMVQTTASVFLIDLIETKRRA